MTAPPPAATPPPEPAGEPRVNDVVFCTPGGALIRDDDGWWVDAHRCLVMRDYGVQADIERGVARYLVLGGIAVAPTPAPGVSAAPTTTSSDASGETRDALVKAVRHAWVEVIPARWADLAVDAVLAALAPAARGESPTRPGAPAPGPDTARDRATVDQLRQWLAEAEDQRDCAEGEVSHAEDEQARAERERDDLKAAVEKLAGELEDHLPGVSRTLRALLIPPDAGRDDE